VEIPIPRLACVLLVAQCPTGYEGQAPSARRSCVESHQGRLIIVSAGGSFVSQWHGATLLFAESCHDVSDVWSPPKSWDGCLRVEIPSMWDLRLSSCVYRVAEHHSMSSMTADVRGMMAGWWRWQNSEEPLCEQQPPCQCRCCTTTAFKRRCQCLVLLSSPWSTVGIPDRLIPNVWCLLQSGNRGGPVTVVINAVVPDLGLKVYDLVYFVSSPEWKCSS